MELSRTELTEASVSPLELARTWISKCAVSHKLCKNAHLRSEQDVRLPTRLIYVGDGLERIRLIMSKDIADITGTRYTTLSRSRGDLDRLSRQRA